LEATGLYDKTLGSLLGGLIGDAMGTPCEGKTYRWIEENLGWVDDFASPTATRPSTTGPP
jgi:ADP-ribosylglycohydrolase